MKNIFDLNYSLIVALVVQVLCQVYKFIYYSIKEKAINPKYLATAGGMPSAHSAFVTSLSLSIGLISGFSSPLFAIAGVFAVITIYDAYRVRGTVQKQSKIINALLKEREDLNFKNVEEMVGHSIPEIIAGIITGALLALGLYLLYTQGLA
ncbi:MAG: divergent PAP2 family protein [Spirochaetales bacterium]|nr:divergent PAP2 family protein [Spirochaetales bacterium]